MLEQTTGNNELGHPLLQHKRASTGSLTLSLSPLQPEPVVVHAGAVISMLHLIPGITCTNEQVHIELVLSVNRIIINELENTFLFCQGL